MPALTSAYGSNAIEVRDLINEPTWLQERILHNLEGSFLEEGIFRNAGSNKGTLAYREAALPFLNDEPEEVAEFAEIPISNINVGEAKYLMGVKVAHGVSISYEMLTENQLDVVNKQVTALQNTMVYSGAMSVLKAFEEAPVQSMAVTVDWEQEKANVMKDIRAAARMVSSAAPEGASKGKKFGYRADTLLMSDSTVELALGSESVQKFYNGNLAAENPLYKGITPAVIGNLRVVTSPFIPDGEAYVLQSDIAGFVSDTMPLTVTDMYSPHGDNGFGGATMSWRIDAFRKRIIGIDNPKAIVKITGIGG